MDHPKPFSLFLESVKVRPEAKGTVFPPLSGSILLPRSPFYKFLFWPDGLASREPGSWGPVTSSARATVPQASPGRPVPMLVRGQGP